MKKKDLKKLETVSFIVLEIIDRAIEMKRLNIDEMKMKMEYEKFSLSMRQPPKCQPGGVMYSPGCPEPQRRKSTSNFEGIIKEMSKGEFVPVELSEETLQVINNLFERPVRSEASKPLSDEQIPEFVFPKRNRRFLDDDAKYRFVSKENGKNYLGNDKGDLFFFVKSDSRDIVLIKTPEELEAAISKSFQLFYRWQ